MPAVGPLQLPERIHRVLLRPKWVLESIESRPNERELIVVTFHAELKSNPVSSFYGNSYLVLPAPRIPIKDKRAGVFRNATLDELAVSLNFSTIATGGLLLWAAPAAHSFLGVGLQNGAIKVTWHIVAAGAPLQAFTFRTNVSDGAWHMVGIHISPTIMRLRLDDDEMVLQWHQTAEQIDVFSVKGSIYIGMGFRAEYGSWTIARNMVHISLNCFQTKGGLPGDESVLDRTSGQYDTNFNGCINNILYGNNTHDIQEFSTFVGENVGTCDY